MNLNRYRWMLGCLVSSALMGGTLFVDAQDGSDSSWIPDRRRDQFQRDGGYAILPYVFDLPGIGSGYGVLGAVNNVGGTCADVVGTFFEGDVRGQVAGLNSVHLIPGTLILDFGAVHINNVTVQSYSERGMGSGKDDYLEAEISGEVGVASRMTATFYERRLEGYVAYYGGEGELTALRDADGNVIEDAEDAASDWTGSTVLGSRVDLTDDYLDPRRGVRFEPSIWWTPPAGDSANYYFLDASVTAYLPVGKRNTWAFNYLRSDSHVLEKGEINEDAVATESGLDASAFEDNRTQQFIDTLIAENTFGNATSLGGVSRLRSYPEGRFQGSHTEFIGTEFRWNLTDEVTPFDIIFMKDVRTAIQLAPFYEIGSVVDDTSELWSETRQSYGAGIRMVTGSGLIYRLDLATGDEGFQTAIFFQYPWEL